MVQKPGFYTGTLVYAISMFAVLTCLCVAMFSNPAMRQKLGFFTLIITVGTIVIMTHICMRIIQAEQAVFGEADLQKVHHVSPCPDAYVLDEESDTCKPNADILMTIGGETIPGYDGVKFKFNGSSDLPKVDDGEKMNMQGIRNVCDSDRMDMSYAEFRPLCGDE